MASQRTMQSGDTWPPLRGLAADSDGPLDLSAAASMRVLLKGKTALITLTATAIQPPVVLAGEIYNWEADFAPGDTDIAGDYATQLEVTWSTGNIETFPNSHAGMPTVTIEVANDD